MSRMRDFINFDSLLFSVYTNLLVLLIQRKKKKKKL